LLPPGTGRYPNTQYAVGNGNGSVFFHILPYMERNNEYKASYSPKGDPHGGNAGLPDYTPYWNNIKLNMKIYTCPSDPTSNGSITGWTASVIGNSGFSSYSHNGQIFSGNGWFNYPPVVVPFYRYPASITDGTTNTIFFTENYAECTVPWYDWGPVIADSTYNAYGFVQPTGPASLFLVQPPPGNVACLQSSTLNVAISPHTGGINVALASGTVRFLARGLSGTTWWSAMTPASGEVLGSDW
jgi:hypothetical protein